eukprot:363308-Chlamydomonas_euryale.AAC.12
MDRHPPAHTCSARCRPSNEKGVVTMPTVRMPISRAAAATTGAAPLPVPPPMPAVTNTCTLATAAKACKSFMSQYRTTHL